MKLEHRGKMAADINLEIPLPAAILLQMLFLFIAHKLELASKFLKVLRFSTRPNLQTPFHIA